MTNKRIMFITIYDQTCPGARTLMSNVISHGHEARLVILKGYRNRDFYFDNPDDMTECRRVMEQSGNLPMLEYHISHDIMCPYPYPISDEEMEILYHEIRTFDPDVLGMSLTSSFVPVAREVSRKLKTQFPKKILVWGGIHCILAPQDGIGYADVICNSEADEILAEFLEDPLKTDRNGFWFCRDGHVIRNSPAPLPQNLDGMPFPSYGDREREILIADGKKDFWQPSYPGEYILLTQRGCPLHCTYCIHAKTREIFKGKGKYVRRRRVPDVISEVRQMQERFPIETVVFWDDLFMINKTWIEEFCDRYKGEFPNLPFGAYGHHQFTDRWMLERLRDAGCEFTSIGIQSGSPYILKEVFHRNDTPDTILEFARLILDAGIPRLNYDLMSNAPFEREEDCRATLGLLSRLPKPWVMHIKKLQFYPHAGLKRDEHPLGRDAEEMFHFYNTLYTLMCKPGIEPAWVLDLADDPFWRKNVPLLQKSVLSILKPKRAWKRKTKILGMRMRKGMKSLKDALARG